MKTPRLFWPAVVLFWIIFVRTVHAKSDSVETCSPAVDTNSGVVISLFPRCKAGLSILSLFDQVVSRAIFSGQDDSLIAKKAILSGGRPVIFFILPGDTINKNEQFILNLMEKLNTGGHVLPVLVAVKASAGELNTRIIEKKSNVLIINNSILSGLTAKVKRETGHPEAPMAMFFDSSRQLRILLTPSATGGQLGEFRDEHMLLRSVELANFYYPLLKNENFTEADRNSDPSTSIKINNRPDSRLLFSTARIAAYHGSSKSRLSTFGKVWADILKKARKDRQELILLHFWGTWCGPCRKEIKLIQKLSDHMAGEVRVVGLASEELPLEAGRQAVNAFLQENQVSFEQIVIRREDGLASRLVPSAFPGQSAYPLSVLLDLEGNVLLLIPLVSSENDILTWASRIRQIVEESQSKCSAKNLLQPLAWRFGPAWPVVADRAKNLCNHLMSDIRFSASSNSAFSAVQTRELMQWLSDRLSVEVAVWEAMEFGAKPKVAILSPLSDKCPMEGTPFDVVVDAQGGLGGVDWSQIGMATAETSATDISIVAWLERERKLGSVHFAQLYRMVAGARELDGRDLLDKITNEDYYLIEELRENHGNKLLVEALGAKTPLIRIGKTALFATGEESSHVFCNRILLQMTRSIVEEYENLGVN